MTAVVAAAALAGAGCGDDGDGGGDASKSLTITASEPGPQDTKLELPDEVQAGVVRIELRNEGKREHDAQLIRIEGDHSAEEATTVFEATGEGQRIPDWFLGAGGAGTTAPGETRTVTQVLEPGKYILFDTESTGEGDDAPSNYERGGRVEFEVTGEAGGELPASAGARIRAQDYSFDTFDLEAGRNDIVFENVGRQPHHVVALPIAEGKTIDDVRQFVSDEEAQGRPPFDEEAGDSTAVLDANGSQVTQLDLQPGKYALLCFISDRQGGPPHVAKGMVTEATVR